MQTIYYYEYIVKILDCCDSKEEIHPGILCADSFSNAVKELESYYGDEMLEIQMLKVITDGIFDFQDVMESTDFDFIISKKV